MDSTKLEIDWIACGRLQNGPIHPHGAAVFRSERMQIPSFPPYDKDSKIQMYADIMYKIPDYFSAVSLRLSQVMDDIGVNENIVLKRRRAYQEKVMIGSICACLTGFPLPHHCFGSQIEGTTTPGLHSDLDMVYIQRNCNVIQSWQEWKQGKYNLLMIQDVSTPPGYCRLHPLRSDVPLSEGIESLYPNAVYDSSHRPLKRNDGGIDNTGQSKKPGTKHGPAFTLHEDNPKRLNEDRVSALLCRSWPREACPWLTRTRPGHWPTADMMRYAEKSGCFLVPVGHRPCEDECAEWRLSLSMAERRLMFSLNITQIRCYVLLKMIVKTFIKPRVGEIITSYHCKTTMFYCIENTRPHFWNRTNLLTCIHMCLLQLQRYVVAGYCPSYIIPTSNLFSGKMTFSVRQRLNTEIGNLIQSKCGFLQQVPIDAVGERLQHYCSGSSICVPDVETARELHVQVNSILCQTRASSLSLGLSSVIGKANISELQYAIRLLCQLYENGKSMQRSAAKSIIPFLCSTLGTLLACQPGLIFPQPGLLLLHLGIDSDVASGRLKLATAMYSEGEMIKTALVLQDVEERFNTSSVEVLCQCSYVTWREISDFNVALRQYSTPTDSQCKKCFAFCVRFSREEFNCVPHELKYELFRDVDGAEIIGFGKRLGLAWMNMAVVDSLPYLYYLQYVTYRQLGNRDRQRQALGNLSCSIPHTRQLGHKETALNLLGQCMELENKLDDAYDCYRQSLTIRPSLNAANWHAMKLLSLRANTGIIPFKNPENVFHMRSFHE